MSTEDKTACKILLVSANREKFPEPVFPLGIVYLAAALIRKGAAVEIFDAGLHRFPLAALKKTITRFRPDRIGISLRNIDNAAWPHVNDYLPGYKELVAAVRSAASAPIILGGAAFSIFPDELGKILGADAAVTGDGEAGTKLFFRVTHAVTHGFLPEPVTTGLPRNLAKIFPGFSRYRTMGIQTARGCVHKCIYCTYPVLEGHAIRKRSPDDVAEEMAFLSGSAGKKEFFIVDSSFNADEEHMERVLKAVIARKMKIRFSCYLQPRMQDLSLFHLLKEAGCVAVDFGTDSGSPKLMTALKKSFSREDVVKVSKACRRNGLDFCHSLLFGGPGEAEGSIAETVSLMDEIGPAAVVAMNGIRVYPGTEMCRIAGQEQVVTAGESLLEPRFYFGGDRTDKTVPAVYAAAAGRKNWFFPGEKNWSSSLTPRLLSLLFREGPLWRALKRA